MSCCSTSVSHCSSRRAGGACAFGRGRPLVKPQDAAALLAGLGVFVVIGGVWGSLRCRRRTRLPGILERIGDHVPKDTDQVLRLAPEAVDCLAACAMPAAGRRWSAMSVVRRCFTGPVRGSVALNRGRHQLGATYEQTFAELLDDPLLAPVGAVMLRSVESGASLTRGPDACAEQMRPGAGADLENRARAVGVKAVLPLASCFLPSSWRSYPSSARSWSACSGACGRGTAAVPDAARQVPHSAQRRECGGATRSGMSNL